jgi:hypothetical protein
LEPPASNLLIEDVQRIELEPHPPGFTEFNVVEDIHVRLRKERRATHITALFDDVRDSEDVIHLSAERRSALTQPEQPDTGGVGAVVELLVAVELEGVRTIGRQPAVDDLAMRVEVDRSQIPCTIRVTTFTRNTGSPL